MIQEPITVESLAALERFQNYCLHPSKEAIVYWEQWLKQNPTHQTVFEEAKELVVALNLEVSEEEVAQEFTRFKQIVDRQQHTATTKVISIAKSTTSPKKTWTNWIQVAAVGLLLLAMIGVGSMYLVPKPTLVNLTTDFGQIQTHLLPDGSKVILNANSTLRFEKYWSTDSPRKVQLEGEAFFEVKKQSAATQFRVHTNQGIIQVLGTSFNVSQRADLLEVALLEGNVALVTPTHPTIQMQPGEFVRLKKNANIEHHQADVDATSAWRFHRMVLRGVTIEQLTKRLQYEFNLQVIVKNQALLQRKINATMPKNDPELLLKALSEIYDLKIQKLDDQTFVIQ